MFRAEAFISQSNLKMFTLCFCPNGSDFYRRASESINARAEISSVLVWLVFSEIDKSKRWRQKTEEDETKQKQFVSFPASVCRSVCFCCCRPKLPEKRWVQLTPRHLLTHWTEALKRLQPDGPNPKYKTFLFLSFTSVN